MHFRQERLNKLILSELNRLIMKELDFGGALVTLTTASVSKDLEEADIKVSVLPSDRIQDVMEILNKHRRRLHRILSHKIQIRHLPYLNFAVDLGLEKAAGVEKSLLDDYNRGS